MAFRAAFRIVSQKCRPRLYINESLTTLRSRDYVRLCRAQPLTFRLRGFQKTALGLSLLTWLGFTEDDEKKESELIMTLKRAVLATRREEFDKAEQLLHLALRLAQQQQNQQGVLYCFDLMANLAMDRLQLDKAEKLFVTVLQMLLGDGLSQRDLKVIHISLKLARISQLKAEMERADLGFKWCLENLEAQKNDNSDAKILYGVVQDWYAQFLLDMGDVKSSLVHLKAAYASCKEVKGDDTEQSMLLLNDLGTTSFRAGDLDSAQLYLKEAVAVGDKINDKSHVGVVQANLGLILLDSGVVTEAERHCKEAWRLGSEEGTICSERLSEGENQRKVKSPRKKQGKYKKGELYLTELLH